MKKNIYIIAALFVGALSSCDYNEHYFDDFEEVTQPKNVATYEYTFQDGDVSTIVAGLRANKTAQDSAKATAFNSAKVFSEALPASELMPYLLKSKYYAGDAGSVAKVTYKYDEKRSPIVTALSSASYVITDADYKLIWGDPYATAFTPQKSPEKNIPTILKANFKNAVVGDFKNVTYQYSIEEPVDATVVGESFLTETFDKDYVAYDVINKNGWQSIDTKGSYNWQAKTYDNNFFAEVSSNKSTGDNDIWLISPQIDLSEIANPNLSFDISVRYPAGELLSVMVSKDFDGTNVGTATWTNISSKFDIPYPSSSMNDFVDAGMGSLSAFANQKVYVAFRYVGNGTTGKTTTYRIDNVNVFDAIPGIEVKGSETVYVAYKFNGTDWAVSTDEIVLQPSDYATMGVTYLTADNADAYINTYLNAKYPYQYSGSHVVVYKTKDSNQADEFIKEGSSWVKNSFVVEKTDQFIYVSEGSGKQWIFDPTIINPMEKSDYMLVADYVKVNQAVDNPALYNSSNNNAEFYYGFNAYYPNVTYRDKDRGKDPSYPISGTSAEKEKFCNDRTIEGIIVMLNQKYPNATATVSGVDQLAKVTLIVYSSHISTVTNEEWTYTMQCMGNKEWKFIQRESKNSGAIEKAE